MAAVLLRLMNGPLRARLPGRIYGGPVNTDFVASDESN